MRTVTICSGGMDSVTLAHYINDREPGEQLLVTFDYGQRHRREIDSARACAARLGLSHEVVDLSALRPLIATSALTGNVEVPEGHYAEDTMRATVVPNRNMVMLAIAGAVGVARRADRIAIGVHGGDHFVYPDCRPGFVYAIHTALHLATIGHAEDRFGVFAPFLHITKADIVELGDALGVPWADTWSCYVGGDTHCGACGTCYERREAFALADVPDPTTYLAEPNYAAP